MKEKETIHDMRKFYDEGITKFLLSSFQLDPQMFSRYENPREIILFLAGEHHAMLGENKALRAFYQDFKDRIPTCDQIN